MLVDCGHTIPDLPPGHVGATGYATWHQGTPHEEKICYACADERTRASLLSSNRVMGYLHREGGPGTWIVTTWTGGKLGRVAEMLPRNNNFMRRGEKLYSLRVVDVHGQRWYGTGQGEGMYCRLRKNKLQPTGAR